LFDDALNKYIVGEIKNHDYSEEGGALEKNRERIVKTA